MGGGRAARLVRVVLRTPVGAARARVEDGHVPRASQGVRFLSRSLPSYAMRSAAHSVRATALDVEPLLAVPSPVP